MSLGGLPRAAFQQGGGSPEHGRGEGGPSSDTSAREGREGAAVVGLAGLGWARLLLLVSEFLFLAKI